MALGGDDGHRVSRVAQLFREGYAPTVIVAGIEGSPTRERGQYLNWRTKVLADAGVPPNRLVPELSATNSFEEATATLVLSDPPHMRRRNGVWGKAFAGTGKSYILVASEPVWWNADQWWRNERSGQFVITKIIKIGYYVVKH